MTAHVVAQPHPFSRQVHRFDVIEGTSVLDIVHALEIPERFHGLVEVSIAGHVIPHDRWARVKPRAGAAIAIRVIPQGGGGSGGGKNVLASILMLAVLVIATVVAGPIASSILGAAGIAAETAILGTTITAFALTKAVVAATIMMVGGLLVNALIPPPKQEGNAVGQRALITGVQNRLIPYGTAPRIVGKRRVYPMLAARPYTEAVGPRRFLRVLLLVGMGPLEITDIKIGETPVGVYTNIQTEIREGWTNSTFGALPGGKSADAAPTLFTSQVRETGVNALLSYNTPVTRTTLTNTSEISIDVDCPLGLASYDGKQRRLEMTVLVAVEWRAVGAGSWTSVVWEGNDTADGTQTNGVLTLKDATATPTTRGGRWKVPGPGQYEVRLTRTTIEYNSPTIVERASWTILRSIAYEDPVKLPGCALIAMRIQVTDQFQGMPDTINCVAESYLPTWNGSSWTYAKSANPAWAFADLLRRRFTEARIPDSRINLPVLSAWATACDATAQDGGPMWRVNGVLEGGSLFDALRMIASHGRASLSVIDGKYGVVRDAAQATPVQLISPRNSWGYSGTKPFIDFPHALKVQFVNADKLWQDDQVVVYDDGYDENNATRFETLQLVHCTSSKQAWREGRYNLAVGRLRPEEHIVSMDIEALRCTAGDRVELTHDVIAVGLGAARITALATSGSNITAIDVDASMALTAAVNYSVRIRKADGTQLLLALAVPGATTETRTLTLASSTPISGGPEVGDLLTFGTTGAVTMPCIVKRILPGSDLTARLILAPYAPAIYTADTGTIPAFNSYVTVETELDQLPPDDPVFTLASDETALEQLSNGTLQDRIVVWIETPASSRVSAARYDVQWRRAADGAWQSIAPVDPGVRAGFISPVTVGQLYDVRVRAVSARGVPSAWVVEAAHEVIGKSTVPANVTGFAAVNQLGGVQLTWTANQELDIAGYTIKRGVSWAAGTLVAAVVKGTAHFVGLDQADTGRTFWIKAVDVMELESATAATATATGTPTNAPTTGSVTVGSLAPDVVEAAITEQREWFQALQDEFNTFGRIVSAMDADYAQRDVEVTARFGQLTANGFLKVRAAADQSGAYGRVELGASASDGTNDAYGALTIEAFNNGGVAVSRATIKADQFFVQVSNGTDATPFQVATIGGTPAVRMTVAYIGTFIRSDDYTEDADSIPTLGWKITADGIIRAKGAIIRDANLSIADVRSLSVKNPPNVAGVDYGLRQTRMNFSGTVSGYGFLSLLEFIGVSPRYVSAYVYCNTTGGSSAQSLFSARMDDATLFNGFEIPIKPTTTDTLILNPTGTATIKRVDATTGAVTTWNVGPVFNPLILNPSFLEIVSGDVLTCLPQDEIVQIAGFTTAYGRSIIPVVVPPWAKFLDVLGAWGAGGAGGDIGFVGGPGEFRAGKFAVTPGETLYVAIGRRGLVESYGASVGYGGKSHPDIAAYWRAGGGMTAIWRGPPAQANLLIAAGAGGSAAKSAHGGAGGHASEAGQNGLSGAIAVMRGINGGETNATVTAPGAAGGGGNVGGGNYGGAITAAAGRGGTGMIVAGATGASNAVGTRGSITAPNEASAYWLSPYGRGGNAQADGNDGLLVFRWTTS